MTVEGGMVLIGLDHNAKWRLVDAFFAQNSSCLFPLLMMVVVVDRSYMKLQQRTVKLTPLFLTTLSLYLHSTCLPPVGHSNLKAANILLDDKSYRFLWSMVRDKSIELENWFCNHSN
ncbi:hypothetical protein RHMOL_Rhmol05G0091200 [Rhododendron molle]|uniref:Uncharacterized protein n=1 Tax=Rhododendron molle TaxID=49168 RepID=A0ACC0NMX7_RHOML|nr:hypothetical protein RHMOL_Rhmol05G0091200 [Rhododendron molle]